MVNFRTGLVAALLSLILVSAKVIPSESSASVEATTARQTVKVLRIPPLSGNRQYEFVGQLTASDRTNLTFQVSGQITDIHIQIGNKVKKGQLLASLDPADYQLSVYTLQAEYDLAKLKADQAEQLFSKQLVSEDFFDQANTRLTSAQALLEQAKTDLERCSLEAPFDGEISYRFVRSHQIVSAHQSILSLQRSDEINASFDLPNPLSRNLLRSNPPIFEVTVDHLPSQRFKAVLNEISSAPDPNTNSYHVNLLIKKPVETTLLPGLTAKIVMTVLGQLQDDIEIPAGAIIEKNKLNAKVWRIDENSLVTAVEVELDEYGHLRNGLDAGDVIVSAGATSLHEKQPVRIWEKERGI